MRLQSLELIRYGRFTDRSLNFPPSHCDFHLIVGPNEAGKSTLRRAVAELLFGMPLRSEMDFVHPLAELRLGAVIESAGVAPLAFHRARGRKSLRRPDDSPLPDTALADHLGSSSQGLFERMFCLDLPGLLQGGQSILDASDDMGQLLFQSAAGLADLGRLRDALAQEADGLYAPRRSEKRAFYLALDQVEAARRTLRECTVNTRVWSAAVAEVERLEAAAAQADGRWRQLATQRQQLERLRRIAPRVAQWQELQEQLAALGPTLPLPADAAQRLAEAEVALATQAATLQLQRRSAAQLQQQLQALTPDDAVLAQAAAVKALAEQGQACAHHLRDIGRREDEVQQHLREAAALAAQLGWPGEEAALRERLPSPLMLKALSGLMQQRGALLQAQESAERALARTQNDLARLETAAAGPGHTQHTKHTDQTGQTGQAEAAAPSPLDSRARDLQTALRQAQPLLAAAHLRSLETAAAQASDQLDQALAALGPWRQEVVQLAGLSLPSEERLSALKAEHATAQAACATALQQQALAQEQARRAALALAQFGAAQQVVTPQEVFQARRARNTLWQGIREQPQTLDEAAPRLDQAIEQADTLVDRLRDQADQAARLIGLRQAAEREEAAALAATRQADEAARRCALLDSTWADQAAAIGLPGMPLLDLSGWLGLRRNALQAGATLDQLRRELAARQQAETQAAAALAQALRAFGPALPDPDDSGGAGAALAALCSRAEQLLAEHQTRCAQAAARAEELARAHQDQAQQALQLQHCCAAVAQWQQRWQAALAAASLQTQALPAEVMTPDLAQAAVERVEQLRERLGQVDELRVQRIHTMQRDLADFDRAAAQLRCSLAPASAGGPNDEHQSPADTPDSHAWAAAMLERLQRARDVHKEQQRLLNAQRETLAALQRCEAALAASQAAVAPLYTLAQTAEPATLRERIAASDQQRRLQAQLQPQRQALLEAGDGASFEALLAEHGAAATQDLKAQLELLDGQLEAVAEERRRLAVELNRAQAERDHIHGGDAAAQAESKRLEALSQLGDVAERYLQVATGHRLLRWAVDRYRERRQGPLLQRASALFAQLTLGGFARLAPDFEHDPPRLEAVRASGERVGIHGLSEGTRDQLFLALRLAALELHIAADRPLPFIADDLFVNFHDQRSRAGLTVLGELARKTQVIFLTHHEHLVEVARECIGPTINVLELEPR
ncbi:MAG TPA: AAA family ATPase [Burkholderiaceae bacterium]|nr:AAA family ATPase [Burkholderiaceae bacterium]